MKDKDTIRKGRLLVSMNLAEFQKLDKRRGHYPRAVFARAALLGATLKQAAMPELATTWQESARLAACLTQLNEHVLSLNTIRLNHDESVSASKLRDELELTRKMLSDFRASLEQSK